MGLTSMTGAGAPLSDPQPVTEIPSALSLSGRCGALPQQGATLSPLGCHAKRPTARVSPRAASRPRWHVAEQALQKGSQLAVAGCPIAARVRLDRLIEVPERRHELERLEELVNLVVGLRKLDLAGQGSPKFRIAAKVIVADDVAVARQTVTERNLARQARLSA